MRSNRQYSDAEHEAGALRSRAALLLGVVGALLLAVMLPAGANVGAPSGNGIEPVQLPGNPNCMTIESLATNEHKYEPVSAGANVSVPLADDVTLSFQVSTDKRFIDFSISGAAMFDVLVKAGTESHHYHYPRPVTSDTDLHGPVQRMRGPNPQYFEISHVSFCWDYAPLTLICGEETVFTGENEPTYTVLPVNGEEDCDKNARYLAGFDENGNQFVLLDAAGDPVVFLEKIEFLTEKADGDSQIPFELLYLDDLALLGDGVFLPAKLCKLDPREFDTDGNPLFSLASPYDTPGPEGAGLVLPGEETTCIISAQFIADGFDEADDSPLVKAIYWLYNKGDGVRILAK